MIIFLIRMLKLKIDTQFLDNHQVKLTVVVDPEPMEDARRRAARKIAQKIKIPGFRPGKAPYAVIERTVGQGAIIEDALDILIKDLYPKIIEESGVKPYGPGHLENITSLDPPTLEIIVPLKAEVKLGDYRNIRLPYNQKPIEEADINHAINDLRERQAVIEPVERPIQPEDQVSIRLSGKRLNISPGENPTLIEERSYPINVKSPETESQYEWPYPGFSPSLIGLSKGDEKTITHTFPEDSDYISLRGQEVEFHFFVEQVKERHLPALDDQFAQSIGEYETLEALRAEVRQNLEEQATEEYNNTYHEQVLNELQKGAEIKFSPPMLDDEITNMIRGLENRLSQQSMDLETYLKTRQMSIDDLRKEITPRAEERLKRSLVIYEISRLENIKVPEGAIEQESMRTLNEMGRYLKPDQARKTLSNEFIQGMVGSITADLIVKHTLDRMRTIAQGELVPELDANAAIAAQSTSETIPTEQSSTIQESITEQVNQEATSSDLKDSVAS
jgi:trigger factor